MVCVEALMAGKPTCCDEELLQEFCAQTLAHLARSFRTRLPESNLKDARDGLECLLAMHADGPKCTWKQLALALTCADLWLGSCVVASVLEAATLPEDIRHELLVLPTELLFSDRALPLDDVRLRRTAAMALFTTCQAVFPHLLQSSTSFPTGEEGKSLQVCASWLRAVRKSLRLLPGCDEASPLRVLAEHGDELVAAAQLWPGEACEVAQQLALWPGCDSELAAVLGPLLTCLFSASFEEPKREVMLPLLQDLAGNCWPRAALGDLDLDWQAISIQAIAAIHSALDDEDADSTNVEAALGVWQTFAVTLCKGQADAEEPKAKGIDGIFEPRQKRSRRRDQWNSSRDRIARTEALPELFGGLIEQLLERLRAPELPTQDELLTIWEMREAAKPAIAAWAALLGEAHSQAKAAQLEHETQRWFEAAWSPLHRLCQRLREVCQTPGAAMSEEICSGSEVVLWFSATLAGSWPDQADEVPVKLVLPELGMIDIANYPWQPLLWSSACSFAAKAPAEHAKELLQWMLQRSPAAALTLQDHPVNDIMELTELQYAQALETVSRQLPRGDVHVAAGDRFAAMALDTFPYGTGHKDSTKSQALLLLALRHAMGSDAGLLCKGLQEKALPLLCDAVESEVQDSSTDNNPPWNATQALFSTLICALPEGLSTDLAHPALPLWREKWQIFEGALLYWPQSSTTDQPAASAVEACVAGVRALPALLPEALQLLSQSAKAHPNPDVQLDGLRNIAVGVPCPPVEPSKAADLLSTAILGIFSDLLMQRREDLLTSPSTLIAVFRLQAEAVDVTPSVPAANDRDAKDGDMEGGTSRGLCQGKLREKLLSTPDFAQTSLELAAKALQERAADSLVTEILRFCAGILGNGREADVHGAAVLAALPMLCIVVCHALNQECLLDLEILEGAAEVLTLAAVGFGADFAAALQQGLDALQVPAFNRERLEKHVAACAEWGSQKMEWLEQLQQIVREWQSERRHAAV
jgi:hypothetical protein